MEQPISHSVCDHFSFPHSPLFFSGGGLYSIEFDTEQSEHLQKMWDMPLKGGGNEEYGLTVGGHFSLAASVGFGVLAGVEGGAEVNYDLDVSHHILQDTDSESSTSISFELGDPELSDEFLVDVWLDPTYGTFIFDTVGGTSSCPHENGTNAIEIPRIRCLGCPVGITPKGRCMPCFSFSV